MSVKVNETQVVTRIGFAERWLHRAKCHYGDGDATRGLLSVVLADAEMRYALESGGMNLKASPRRLWIPALLLAGTLAVLAAVTTDWLLPPPAASGAAADPHIFRLTSPVGMWLTLVQTASPVNIAPRSQVRRDAVRRSAVRAATVRPAPSPAVGAVPSVSYNVAPIASPSQPAPVVVVPPAAVLSTAELIDLAISADRTLRRAPTP
ncbi:MAG TPA: hypothetical protein VFV60_02805 [bacterium]|nr:hypothetical protein [bacterium]